VPALIHKNIFITGPTEGIGKATAVALAKEGANLHLLCRDRSKAEALREQLRSLHNDVRVELYIADLGDFQQVREAAQSFVRRNEPLDVLINNAGLINTRRILLDNGQEQMFAVNHLGHFLLTQLLRGRLEEAEQGRIVVVASDAYKLCRGIRFEDLQWGSGFKTFRTYGHSKLANILFVRELAKRLQGTRVTANALHPGAVKSRLGAQNNWYAGHLLILVTPFLRSAERGAATGLYLATSDEVRNISGEYFVDCRVKETKPWGQSASEAQKLWQLSEHLVSL
jgi:NAD(P)-dependent dehydrogenase (short-subunit alcohol dehydrogenase family)